jgi:hypothetical protein
VGHGNRLLAVVDPGGERIERAANTLGEFGESFTTFWLEVGGAEPFARDIRVATADIFATQPVPCPEVELPPRGKRLPDANRRCGRLGPAEIRCHEQGSVATGHAQTKTLDLQSPALAQRRVGLTLPASRDVADGLAVANKRDSASQRAPCVDRP